MIGIQSKALHIVLMLVFIVCPSVTSGQTRDASYISIGDRFTSYSAHLSFEADRLLSTSTETRVSLSPRIASVETSTQERPFSKPSFSDFAARFWNGREKDLGEALARVQAVRPALASILREEGVPPEFAAVVLIESAGRPDASSRHDARGLWQFIPATARRYGLEVNEVRDERLSVEKSTRAAARYLRELYLRFGDWPLALAAYNAGEYGVGQAIHRSGSSDFGELSRRRLLPEETRNYVPAVLAALNLMGGGTIDMARKSNEKSFVGQIVHATADRPRQGEEPEPADQR